MIGIVVKYLNVIKNIKNYSLFLIFASIFLIDRATKYLVIYQVNNLGVNNLYNSKYLNLELIWNKGIAFGLFSFSSNIVYNFVSLIIFFVILILLILLFRSKKNEKLFFTLILGGAIGNLYDRIIYKSVPDFIDFHFNNFHWFIFNIADIFITIGVLGLVFIEMFFKKND